eukprot:TRINITY_DN624_c0_g1::TRINITY_DN624_c0_g1_i1::g.28834::m.28834 TRINITY_DN624_c0_g1::TRINITY_DN624_c0_g1_i1::g.28834  ORF type:complete len:537 (+),score=178.13,sp/P22360/KPYK_EMENI/54.29/0.0,PK/PF00224.16/2.5e-160,PK_C/PF02887.11/1.9e+02,PK_C/PF02887.11/1.7e-26,HpcH_HpaI/PF03328.9/0.0015,IMPDH/PF00478.20/0.094,IMPDH/PF00478.20/65 TRINITY_DN624_c0_g1_i1:41-1612(+)
MPHTHCPRSGPSRLTHNAALSIYTPIPSYRKTSIICTLGPKTKSPEMIRKLIEAGMNICRLNFSHGDHSYHQEVVDNIRKAVNADEVIGLALDTKGPEIRTGVVGAGAEKEIELVEGNEVIITTEDAFKDQCSAELIWVDYKNLPKVVPADGMIFIDDGLVSLKVLEIVGDTRVRCRVVNSGMIGSKKGVNLPGSNVDLPALSERDKLDLAFGVRNQVDMIFASFIRKRADILEIRKTLGDAGRNIKIIAKIENQEGVNNFNDILEECDGVMVARGDLGIEIPAQKVFLAQKMMISRCNLLGKPVICATQMLESMMTNPRPTRAESSDVANAVLDGADCVMLSGETAKGKYPLEAVHIMAEICKEAESAIPYFVVNRSIRDATPKPLSTTEAIGSAAVTAAYEQRAAIMVVLTVTGSTARAVAKYRPPCPILAVTRQMDFARQLLLSRAVIPLYYNCDPSHQFSPMNVQQRIQMSFDYAKQRGFCQDGDVAVVLHGTSGGMGGTSLFRVIRIGEEINSLMLGC